MWYTVYKINNLHINLNVWVIVRQILKQQEIFIDDVM